MAGNVPATHTFKGDGVTRVFPISTKIIGDDYVRIEIDSEYIFDRKSWDIVNNSIIFTVAPANNTTVLIKVAESVEAVGLLDNQSTADIIEANIPVINDVYNNLDKIDNVEYNLESIQKVASLETDINIVSNKMPTLEIISESLGDLQDIKNHNNLTGRDQANAHPISAITGLQETLDGLSNDGGLFPSLASDYLTRDTYLSCKISPTELRAIHIDDVLNGTYNNTPETPTVYGNLGIDKDVYGDFNQSSVYYKSTQNIRYRQYSALYPLGNQSSFKYLLDPTNTDRYFAISGEYIYFDIYYFNSSYTSLNLNVGSHRASVITDNKKLVSIGTGTDKKVSVLDLNTRTFSYINGTEGIQHNYLDLQLHPNGKVYGIPGDASSVLEIDPETLTYNLYGDLGALNSKYSRGFLGVNGNIYMLPANASKILEFNPTTKTIVYYGTFTNDAFKFSNGTIGVDGKIYFFANQLVTDNLYIFDVNTKEIQTKPMRPYFGGSYPSSPVAPNITRITTGVDGLIYFGTTTAISNSILLPYGIHTSAYDPFNDSIVLLSDSTVTYFTYSLNNEIMTYDSVFINSNKGNHYWVMSNYFWKGR